MSYSHRVYRGQLIGAAALAFLFWGLPLVSYALFGQLDSDNPEARMLAARWAGRNQSVLLAIFAFVAALALWFDTRQRRRMEAQWTLRRTIGFAAFIAAFQWIVPLATADRAAYWAVRSAEMSFNLFGFIVLTRLIARETEKLERAQGAEKLEERAVTA